MNLREMLAYEAEKFAYELVLIGVLCDQLTTRYFLRHPFISEANPCVVWFMKHRLWIPVDVALIIMVIGLPFILLRRWSFRGRYALLLGPMTFGTLRLLAAVLNLNMWLKAIMLIPV